MKVSPISSIAMSTQRAESVHCGLQRDRDEGEGLDRSRRCFLAGVLGQCALGLGLAACSAGSTSDAPSAATPPPSTGEPPPPLPPPVISTPVTFPLRVEAGKRYLVDADGKPFLIHGDTAWSIVGQLNDAEIDLYLQDRASKGVTAILFSAPEAYYTNASPSYQNADGVAPFAPMTNFASPAEAYWRRVDRVVDGARSRGMACVINPAYLGAIGDGWLEAVNAASEIDLRTYGAWLANRYTQGNIIWCVGGDHDSPNAIARQWSIVQGMRTVRASDIVTGHPLADKSNADDAYAYWGDREGFTLNSVYGWEQNGFHVDALCAQARARPMPFLFFEGQYENEGAPVIDAAQLRRQSYGALLSGACGQFFGNNPIWHFESRRRPFAYPGTWRSNLNSRGSIDQIHVRALFVSCDWWKLEPSTDSSLVTSGLGRNGGHLYAARANDRSFAMVYVPAAQLVSIDMTALSPQRVRARFYDPTRGDYTAVPGSPFPNTGVASLRTSGERVIVLDGDEPAA